MEEIVVKIKFENGEIRRFSGKKEDLSFSWLLSKIGGKIEEFKYIDNEGDKVLLMDEGDMKEALKQLDSPKLIIFAKQGKEESKEKEETEIFSSGEKRAETKPQQQTAPSDFDSLTPFFKAKFLLEKLGFSVDNELRKMIIQKENDVVQVLMEIAEKSKVVEEEEQHTDFFRKIHALERMGFNQTKIEKNQLAQILVKKNECIEEAIKELLVQLQK